jgi:hypothetical protein
LSEIDIVLQILLEFEERGRNGRFSGQESRLRDGRPVEVNPVLEAVAAVELAGLRKAP